jgi:hypothetical protein
LDLQDALPYDRTGLKTLGKKGSEMPANAERAQPSSAPAKGGAANRRLRNYLIDTRFQLKYTGYVVLVTVVVASVLGWLAYQQSHAQTEMLTINMAMQGETADFIERTAHEYDRNMMLAIIGGIAVLTLALGMTGILITHRVVGPAFRMKRLFQDVTDGHLKIAGRLRKGDELQDVFHVYERMIETLRARQREEIDLLERGIDNARQAGASDVALRDLEELKTRMMRALD